MGLLSALSPGITAIPTQGSGRDQQNRSRARGKVTASVLNSVPGNVCAQLSWAPTAPRCSPAPGTRASHRRPWSVGLWGSAVRHQWTAGTQVWSGGAAPARATERAEQDQEATPPLGLAAHLRAESSTEFCWLPRGREGGGIGATPGAHRGMRHDRQPMLLRVRGSGKAPA